MVARAAAAIAKEENFIVTSCKGGIELYPFRKIVILVLGLAKNMDAAFLVAVGTLTRKRWYKCIPQTWTDVCLSLT